MATERTLSIVKPSAVADNHIGAIINKFESAGLKIVAAKMLQLSKEQAEGFYAVHSERPFRSEEHTSELQLQQPISYAVFCLKKIFFNDTATTEIYTLSLHDALPIYSIDQSWC